jgi:hypothetical protein
MLALLIKYKLAVIAVALLGVVGVGGVGVAAASGALPMNALNAFQNQSGQQNTNAAHNGHDGLARHILHGTVIMRANGAWVTYTLDVGRVSAVSSSAISLKRADGSSVTLAVTSTTLWGPKGVTAPRDIAKLVGREVAVLSQNGAAVHVGGRGLFGDVAYADLTLYRNGKTREVQLDRGVVKSVSATQITLTRADGVAVTLPLTAKTRYHQAGVKGPAPASAVKPGETVLLLVVNNSVAGVRIAATGTSAA